MVLKLWVYTHLFSLNSIKTHFSSGTVDYFLFLFHFEHPRKMHLKFFQLPDEEFVNCILRFYITCHYMQPSLASCCFIIYFILTSFVCIMQFFVIEKKICCVKFSHKVLPVPHVLTYLLYTSKYCTL